jgi:hypothetical protein
MGHKGKKGGAIQGRGSKQTKTSTMTELSSLQLVKTTSFNSNDAEDQFQLIDTCVAALQDRRSTIREQAMAALGRVLEALPPLDELDSRCCAVFALCCESIKKSFTTSAYAKEARLAYRVIGLLALALRAGAWDLLPMAYPLLSRTLCLKVSHSHEDAPKLVAALDCLAVVTFIGVVDAKEVELSMKAIWAVISPPASRSAKLLTTPQVLVAAVSAWTFLVTVVEITPARLKADRAAWNANITSLAKLLDHDNRAVRVAAGKALAVCMELNLTQHIPPKGMAALACKVEDLAGEAGGKGVSKTVLPEQRRPLRHMKLYLNDGDRPKEKVRLTWGIDHDPYVLKVSTWVEQFQLHFLRRFLGAGFLKHVQGNQLFEELFCIEEDEWKKLTIAQRRKIAKRKTKAMHRDRDVACEMKNKSFLSQELKPHKPGRLRQLPWN